MHGDQLRISRIFTRLRPFDKLRATAGTRISEDVRAGRFHRPGRVGTPSVQNKFWPTGVPRLPRASGPARTSRFAFGYAGQVRESTNRIVPNPVNSA